MMKPRVFGWPCALCLFFVLPARAGVISISTDPQVKVQDGILHVAVALANRGDEAAHTVQVVIKGHGFDWSSPQQNALPPGGNYVAKFQTPLKGVPIGRYPLQVSVSYADANRYPFTALAATSYLIGQETDPGIWAIADRLQMSRDGAFNIRLKNLEPRAKTLEISVFAPSELSSDPGRMIKTLGPAEESSLSFKIRNFSALPGSNYPVFAVIENQSGSPHQTVITQGFIRIVAPSSEKKYRPIFAGIVLVLALGLVAWKFRDSHEDSSRPRK